MQIPFFLLYIVHYSLGLFTVKFFPSKIFKKNNNLLSITTLFKMAEPADFASRHKSNFSMSLRRAVLLLDEQMIGVNVVLVSPLDVHGVRVRGPIKRLIVAGEHVTLMRLARFSSE